MPDAATEDGYDTQMQSNHLSHFLLTSGVWPLLEKAASLRGEARVCNHSSGARNKPAGDLEARYLQKNGGNLGGDFWSMSKWYRYKQSKLANLLFTYSLHSKATAKGSKVKVVCAHPGATLTNLQMKTAQAGGQSYLDAYILNSTMARAHSEEDGTCGIIKACCLPSVNSGDFYGPEPVLSIGEALLLPAERNSTGEDLLWVESMTATGAAWPF
jgi:NAD(P)-dependent dehydrogenase (short-subunit alcohol dehydrogenase family)